MEKTSLKAKGDQVKAKALISAVQNWLKSKPDNLEDALKVCSDFKEPSIAL